jgi:hypothetical protein
MKRTTIFFVAVLLFAATAMSAHAATITVTNTNDNGPGSLRQALANANNGDRINFVVTGAISLTSGGLGITKNVTISGPGFNQLAVNGNQALFVFGVFPGKAATISGLTVRNAQSGIWNFGTLATSDCVITANLYSGMYNTGILTASNCVISDNSGDGLYNEYAILNVSDCIITGNSYSGIYNFNSRGPSSSVERGNNRRDLKKIDGPSPGELTIANSIISDNSEHGIYNDGGYVMILNSTLSGNSAGQEDGGGIYTSGAKLPGYLMVINSTISGNFALSGGGGIASGFSGLTIVNSTISGNTVGDPDDGYGGGIVAYGGGIVPPTLTITNSTVSGNSAAICGGICGGTVEIANTILNANASGNIGGTVTSRGYNVCSDDADGLLNGPGDQINTNPLLGPLRNNGGPTFTHALLRGSPAIDAGDPNFSPPPVNDQRGSPFVRVFNGRIDIGSFETQPRRRPRPTPPPRP